MLDIRKEVAFDGRCTLHLGQVVISDLSEAQADAIMATYRRVSQGMIAAPSL